MCLHIFFLNCFEHWMHFFIVTERCTWRGVYAHSLIRWPVTLKLLLLRGIFYVPFPTQPSPNESFPGRVSMESHGCCLSLWQHTLTEVTLRGGFIVAQFKGIVHHGGGIKTWGLWSDSSHHILNQEAESSEWTQLLWIPPKDSTTHNSQELPPQLM